MTRSPSSEDLVFDTRTLRLIIGALAFAFPSTVIILTHKITSSISASYYEEGNHDVFVGFLFIMGALLIAYKGHLHGDPKDPAESAWHWIFSFKWIKVYQENIVSTFGGAAAIAAALCPTARPDHSISLANHIHTAGASILFASVVYFTLFAFLRSVNQKLVEDNPDLEDAQHPFQDTWLATVPNFLNLRSQVSQSYDRNNTVQIATAWLSTEARKDPEQFAKGVAEVETRKPNKFLFLWFAYEKKITRGLVYVICGPIIAVTLVVYLYMVATKAEMVSNALFIVETIALVFFGIAWMTASKLEYLKQIMDWWQATFKRTATVP